MGHTDDLKSLLPHGCATWEASGGNHLSHISLQVHLNRGQIRSKRSNKDLKFMLLKAQAEIEQHIIDLVYS